jgi:hypothetical protein
LTTYQDDQESLALITHFRSFRPEKQICSTIEKKFDDAMSIINKKMSGILDKEQQAAQAISLNILNDLRQMV